jgi:hypothetical protein
LGFVSFVCHHSNNKQSKQARKLQQCWISDGGVLLLLILNSTLLQWHPARIRRMFLHDSKASSTRAAAAAAVAE